jgi:hypothetical protein
VDRVFVQGDYLLQISGSTGWYGYQAPPSIRVTPAHDAAFVLNTAQLDDLPIVGISLKNGRLYVAQAPSSYNIVAFDGAGGPGGGPVTNSANFFLTILDATHLPDLPVLGQASADIDSPGWAGNWDAVWSSSNVVVWAGGGGYVGLMPFGGIAVLGPGGFYNVPFWPWWGSPGGELVGFDVGDPAAPRLESQLNLATNQWWSFSKPFCSDTRVYLSHATDEVETNSTNPNGIWSQKYALDVIDYADVQNPTVRAPVNIPGDLQGISHGGELLYTLGMHWATATYPDWTQWLEASAYDGVSAHLVASLALPGAWRNTMLVADTNIFLANPGLSNSGTNTTPPTLQAWSLSAKGAFTLNGSTNLQQSAYLLVERDNLLAAQENFNSLELFDVSAPQTLSRLSTYSPASCLWYDLTDADGGLGRGLWVPLGYYGVQEIRLAP